MPSPKKTRNKIVGFAYLPTGWNFGKGVPAKEQAVKDALDLLDDLEKAGFEKTDAYPGEGGSVMVSAYALPDYYDFDVGTNGTITVAHARRDEDEDIFYEENMSVEEAQSKIKEFALQQWPTSDCSTSVTTTVETKDDSKVVPSKAPMMVLVFPLSATNAQSAPQAEYALIAPSGTQHNSERRPSIGRFPMTSPKTTGR